MQNTTRLTALDGLRGLAALIVAYSHFYIYPDFLHGTLLEKPTYFLLLSLKTGTIAVEMFFVLCGFLMVLLYQNPNSSFLPKRLVRILPPYLVMLVFLAVVRVLNFKITIVSNYVSDLVVFLFLCCMAFLFFKLIAKNSTNKKGKPSDCLNLPQTLVLNTLEVRRNLLHLQGESCNKPKLFKLISLTRIIVILCAFFAFGLLFTPSINTLPQFWQETLNFATQLTFTSPFMRNSSLYTPPFWSLQPEVYFYIVYPFIAKFIFTIPYGKVNHKRFFYVVVSFFAMIFLTINKQNFNLIYPERVVGFVFGVGAGILYTSAVTKGFLQKLFAYKLAGVVVFGVFLVINTLGVRQKWLFDSYIGILGYSLAALAQSAILLYVLCSETMLNKFLCSRTMVFLGSISYSIYLVHHVVVDYLKAHKYDGTMPQFIYLHLTFFMFTLIFAYILHVAAERPYFSSQIKAVFKD